MESLVPWWSCLYSSWIAWISHGDWSLEDGAEVALAAALPSDSLRTGENLSLE